MKHGIWSKALAIVLAFTLVISGSVMLGSAKPGEDSYPNDPATCSHANTAMYEKTAPDCVTKTDGSKELFCDDCGTWIAGGTPEIIPYAQAHDFNDTWEVTTPATCTNDGEETLVCSLCGEAAPAGPDTVKTIPSIHSTLEADSAEIEWKQTLAPTCTEEGEMTGFCTICGDPLFTKPIEAVGHDDGIWQIDFEATADHDGQKSLRCTVCGAVLEIETFEQHEHEFGYAKILTPATCTEEGESGSFCKFCDAMYEVNAIAAAGHDDGIWKIDFEPTADHPGQKTLTCTRCGAVLETAEIEQHEHELGYQRVLTPATCTAAGELGSFCKFCDALYDVEAINAIDHDGGVWKIDFEATPDHDGQMTLYCATCGAPLDTQTFELHEHESGYQKTVAATCDTAGEIDTFCAICGALYEVESIPAAGHTNAAIEALGADAEFTADDLFGLMNVDTKLATCTDKGTVSVKCDICGEVIATIDIEPTGHTAGYEKVITAPTCIAEGEMGTYCATCGQLFETSTIEALGHDDGAWKIDYEATPDHEGRMTLYCTRCGAALDTQTYELHVHTFGYEAETKAATCTEEGELGVYCATCGVVYDTEVIPALGHEYDTWYMNLDGTHSRGCNRCQYTETANCEYTATVTLPTCTEGGYTTYVCDICGFTYVDDYTDPLGHDWSAWTDDGNGVNHSRTCARCGEKETEDHSFGCWVYNRDAKFFKNGTKSMTCEICGAKVTEKAKFTAWIWHFFYPIMLLVGSITHKAVYLASLAWFLPWLNIVPKM